MCVRLDNTAHGRRFVIYNADRNSFHNLNCKSWACPECSKVKIRMMKRGLAAHFVDNRGMRMLTLTLAPSKYTPIEHAKLFQAAYKVFIKNLRRSPLLSESQKQFKYVRCIEQHKGDRCKGHKSVAHGYFHYHIIVDRFLPVEVLQTLLESALLVSGYEPEHHKYCNCHIMLIPNVQKAIGYVIKYILKATKDFANLFTKWSKSKGTPIYTKDKREGIYFLLKRRDVERVLRLYLYNISHESPNIEALNIGRTSYDTNEFIDSYDSKQNIHQV